MERLKNKKSNNVRDEEVSWAVEKHKEREMVEWCRGKRVRERQRRYILPIPPSLASSLFIASHIKVSSLIFSTADIVISPAEVIRHQCNITLSLCPSLLFLLCLYHHGGLLVSRSLIVFLLFQPSLYHFSLSTPSLSLVQRPLCQSQAI